MRGGAPLRAATIPDPQLAPRVLIAVRDQGVRRILETALRPSVFTVRATTEPAAAEVLLQSFSPEILLVDTRDVVPDPTSLVEAAHNRADVFLIAYGADIVARSSALRSLADDATGPEMHADEFAARCEALLRRPRRRAERWNPLSSSEITLGPLSVDFGRREIRVDSKRVSATRLEFDLFAQLCRRPHEVCTRPQLIAAVWDPGWVGDTHVVDVHLSNLRRKLSREQPELEFIRTVRGVGFRISDDLLSVAASQLAELHPLVLPA
jgi:two-component system OmpR family response regulator